MSSQKVSEHVAKVAAERAKRLRPDGIDQYPTLSGEFAPMNEDPFTDRIEREPYRDHVTVAVIGGGSPA